MSKFHVNSAGEPGKCRAKQGLCPFGGEQSHYKNEAEARAAYEATMGGSFDARTKAVEEPISGFFKAPDMARESGDPAVLMRIARGGNKSAIKQLALNPVTPPAVLAEAATKVSETSRVRDMLEAHPAFPTYALRAEKLAEKLKSHNAVYLLDAKDANDVLLTELVKSDSWGSNVTGLKAIEILENPAPRLTDAAIAAAAEASEKYAEAAGKGGRFPTVAYMEEKRNWMGNGSAIAYACRGIEDAEKIRQVWSYMKDSNYASWTAENLQRNPHTPHDLWSSFRAAHENHATVKAANRQYYRNGGSSRGYGSSGSSSSSSSDSGFMNPASPLNPNNWS